MTISFPDISSYERGLTIQPGTVAVIAKATEGTYYRDAEYANFEAQAARVGAVFSAYHFLKAGNGAGQADYCHAMVGSTPVMLDVETEGASKPTVADCAAFIARMRALGGRVWGCYFPRWFWEQVGGDLGSLGVAIVSSSYTAYSDTGPGWAPYGGATPAIWQYTDAQPYGGQTVDFNAFKGTVQQLAALINGTTTPTPEGVDMTPAESTMLAEIHKSAVEYANWQFFVPAGREQVQGTHAWRMQSTLDNTVAIENKLDQLLARPVVQPVDVAALEAFIVQHQGAGASAADLAAALVQHLGIQVVAK